MRREQEKLVSLAGLQNKLVMWASVVGSDVIKDFRSMEPANWVGRNGVAESWTKGALKWGTQIFRNMQRDVYKHEHSYSIEIKTHGLTWTMKIVKMCDHWGKFVQIEIILFNLLLKLLHKYLIQCHFYEYNGIKMEIFDILVPILHNILIDTLFHIGNI